MSTLLLEPKRDKPFDSSANGALQMSYEQFLEWGDEDTFAEWVDGEVIEFMSVKLPHQAVVDLLSALIRIYAQIFDLGIVKTAPYQMRLRRSGREPDVMFMLHETYDQRATESYLDGSAELVVEVVSNDSVRRDRRDKYREYRAAGVNEYWVIDSRPHKLTADFFVLDETGDYDLIATEEDERFESTVLKGFWIKPEWLWDADHTNVMACLLQMDGVAEALQKQIDDAK